MRLENMDGKKVGDFVYDIDEKNMKQQKQCINRYMKINQQYNLKQQEVENLKEKLEAGSHHQQLEEINSLKQNIGMYCKV